MVIILGRWYADVSYVPLQALHLPKSHFAGSGKCHHMEEKNDQKWRWGPTEFKKKTCFKWPRGKAAPMSPATNIVTVDQQHAGTLFWWNSRPVPEANLRKCHRSSSEKKKRTGPLKRWPFFQPTTGAILKTSANLHLAVLLYGLHMLKLYFKNLVQYLHMEIIWKVRKSITSGPFIQNQNTLPETDIFALKNRWLQYYIVSF